MSNITHDHTDTTALAREHLEHAESLLYAIATLLESHPAGEQGHAARLARLGSMEAGMAADQFRDQERALLSCGAGMTPAVIGATMASAGASEEADQ